MVETNQRTWLI